MAERGTSQRQDGDTSDAKPAYPISSVDKALRLLLVFRDQQQLRLSDVSQQIGVSPSTAHRLLAMLMYHGFVNQQGERGVYVAGPALLEIGYGAVRNLDLRSLAQPVLERLVERIDETVHLAQLEAGQVRYLAGVESYHYLRVADRTGQLFPAHETATGRAILAGLTPSQLAEALVGATGEGGRLSPAELEALEERLEQVRSRGYSINNRPDGVVSVAVAVTNSRGLAVAAINASAPENRMGEERVKEVVAALQDAAGELGASLATI